MRAREPAAAGRIERDGVRVGWERWDPPDPGDRDDLRLVGNPTLLFACTTPIVESRMWKAQIPWFSQRFTCIAVDPRGNGRSDRVADPAALADHESVRDLLAVLDANDVDEAVLVGLCSSAGIGLLVAAGHPERVAGLVAINPGLDVTASTDVMLAARSKPPGPHFEHSVAEAVCRLRRRQPRDRSVPDTAASAR